MCHSSYICFALLFHVCQSVFLPLTPMFICHTSGSPSPLGPSRQGSAVNFALYAPAASEVKLLIHNPDTKSNEEVSTTKSGRESQSYVTMQTLAFGGWVLRCPPRSHCCRRKQDSVCVFCPLWGGEYPDFTPPYSSWREYSSPCGTQMGSLFGM